MTNPNVEARHNTESNNAETDPFGQKFHELLPGIDLPEPAPLAEARPELVGILRLAHPDSQEGFEMREAAWQVYYDRQQQVVDEATGHNSKNSIPQEVQLGLIVHEALIHNETRYWANYFDELTIAAEFAYQQALDEVVATIDRELDELNAKYDSQSQDKIL